MDFRKTKRGQMLVIVAIGMVVMVAMIGLVVDGGFAWTNRRQIQNAADAAALAGTRVLAADVKARALGAPSPIVNPDASICTAINEALAYNEPEIAPIDPIPCTSTPSDDAVYVDFQRATVGQVGAGTIPISAQGVEVRATGVYHTMLMQVVGFSNVDIGADAAALAGPAAPPLGKLMPFVVQNPAGKFEVGKQYEVRSQDEETCPVAAAPRFDATYAASRDTESSFILAVAPSQKPRTPVANPPGSAWDGTSVTYFQTSLPIKLEGDSGAKIYYTLDGSNPTSTSKEFQNNATITITTTTTLRAVAIKNGVSSDVGSWSYDRQGPIPGAPTANPPSGTPFTTTLDVSLTAPGAVIYYTTDGRDPVSSGSRQTYTAPITLTTSSLIRAVAYAQGAYSEESQFNYTKDGETPVPTPSPTASSGACPGLTPGNFGWIDFSGGNSSNNDLNNWVSDPSTVPPDWYYDECSETLVDTCRDVHNADDPSDDHWLLEGTTGNRQNSLNAACKYVVSQSEVYVPIWDTFEPMAKKPNGANAVFHIIGFAVFKIDGVIDNKGTGDPTNKVCGVTDSQHRPNDKGFIATYLDSFIGTQAQLCLNDPISGNPCTNLSSSSAFTINLAK